MKPLKLGVSQQLQARQPWQYHGTFFKEPTLVRAVKQAIIISVKEEEVEWIVRNDSRRNLFSFMRKLSCWKRDLERNKVTTCSNTTSWGRSRRWHLPAACRVVSVITATHHWTLCQFRLVPCPFCPWLLSFVAKTLKLTIGKQNMRGTARGQGQLGLYETWSWNWGGLSWSWSTGSPQPAITLGVGI